MPSHPPGTIGVLSGDLARYSSFSQSLLALAYPPETQILWVSGLWIAHAVNKIISNMAPESQWVQLLADDHVFEPDMLLKLLDRQVDIVAPLCCLRSQPYAPSLFQEDAHGFCGYTWTELDGKVGLLPVDTMGGPGCVIRRAVLAATGPPWFVGQAGEFPQEDLTYFARCRRAGFQPYVDLDVPIGHSLAAAVYPQRMPTGEYNLRFWSQADIGVMRPVIQAAQPAGAYHAVT
jgi:hypothetical protein